MKMFLDIFPAQVKFKQVRPHDHPEASHIPAAVKAASAKSAASKAAAAKGSIAKAANTADADPKAA
jgi:hypothetical protein